MSTVFISDRSNNMNLFKEIDDWCRDYFSNLPNGADTWDWDFVVIWDNPDYGRNYTFQFEKDATLFILRWK